jgi:phytanoyl-CoA hydroxylase
MEASLCEAYERDGYVVVPGLVDGACCDRAREAFAHEIKPYRGHLYRQASANPEINLFTPNGFVLNSILNIQDIPRARFPAFVASGMDVLTHAPLQQAVKALLGEPGVLVQSMYFEGNPATWAHQDTYYLDATRLGAMAGAWIALEDIAEGAGRFFVVPRSHRIDMAKNGGNFDVAFHHERYKQLVLDVIASEKMETHAPALRRGDVLFWSSRTIHGSLETSRPEYSRNSITGHFIPRSTRLLQFQTRPRRMRITDENGLAVHHPKDPDRLQDRVTFALETRFPRGFQWAKRIAIKLLTR